MRKSSFIGGNCRGTLIMGSAVLFLLILENPSGFQTSAFNNGNKEIVPIISNSHEYKQMYDSAHDCNLHTTKRILDQLGLVANVNIETTIEGKLDKLPFLAKDFLHKTDEKFNEDNEQYIHVTDENPKLNNTESDYKDTINETLIPIVDNENDIQNEISKHGTDTKVNDIINEKGAYEENSVQIVDMTRLSNLKHMEEIKNSNLENNFNNERNLTYTRTTIPEIFTNKAENLNIEYERKATETTEKDVFKNVIEDQSEKNTLKNIAATDILQNITNKDINVRTVNETHNESVKSSEMTLSNVNAVNTTQLNNHGISVGLNITATDNTVKHSADRKTESKGNPLMAPYLVAIYETFSNVTAQTCAGTLVSRRWVLTAAHCVDVLSTMYGSELKNLLASNQKSGSIYRITAGAHNLYAEGSTYNVSSVLVHPGWPAQRPAGNVALLQLDSDVEYTESIQPLNLLRAEPDSEVMVESYGWGPTSGANLGGRTVFVARKLSREQCSQAISLGTPEDRADSVMASSQICLVPATAGDCKSNSGGPVVYAGGLLAVGEFEECDSEHTLLASSVPTHAQWIATVTGNL